MGFWKLCCLEEGRVCLLVGFEVDTFLFHSVKFRGYFVPKGEVVSNE